MHCMYESFRTMLGKVDRLYFPKCTHHLFQKFSFQNAERHEAPSRTKKKVRFSLKFIHHPILKTLICATFEKCHIMEKLDSYLSKKRLSPNWQSTSSYPHTYHCYCCSIKHLELRLHTSLRLIVWHVCDCYVFFCSKLLSHSYKHAIDGMARVYREEGLRNLFSGADWATGRWR